MAYGKKNHIKISPTAYNLMLLGEPKIGKSTLLKDVLEELVQDQYLFVEMGREKGADAIEGINYINCPAWSDEFDDWNNSIGWQELVDDICENPTNYNLKVLVVDTYDQYITIAEDEALRLWNRDNPDKRAKSLNASWGGFGAGSKKAIEIMFNAVDRLEQVGVKVWWIGHVRNKSVTDIASGESYEVLSSDQQQNYFNALKKNLHFLALAYIDRQIIKEKTGRKDIKGKDITKQIISEETRKIKFRDDSYVVDCGTRFKEITDTIDLNPTQFITAITDAIKAETEANKGKKSLEDIAQEQKVAEEKRMEKIVAAEAAAKSQKELDEVIDKIKAFVSEHKTKPAELKPLVAVAREHGYQNPLEIDNIDVAMKVLEVISLN